MRSWLVVALFALPAHARETAERVTDGLGVSGAALGLGAAGAALGALPALALCKDTICSGSLGALGVITGGLTGLIAGPLVFDRYSNGNGSLWGAYGGFLVGFTAANGVYQATENSAVRWGSAAFLPFLGMAVGYGYFDPSSPKPSAAVVPDGQGGAQYTLTLGGQF